MSNSQAVIISAPQQEARPFAMGLPRSPMEPSNLSEAINLAKIFCDAGNVPTPYIGKMADILIAIQWGYEVGLSPVQAMQSIAVINGRPTLFGDALLGLVRGSGLLESIEEVGDEKGFTCTVKRRGEQKPIVRTFTIEDARKAGLLDKKGPWQSYTKRMLQMRARNFALRDAFTDVIRGVRFVMDPSEIIDVSAKPHVEAAPAQHQAAQQSVPQEPETYPQEKFLENLPKWARLIREGKWSCEHVIQTVESHGVPFTIEQRATLESIPVDVPEAVAEQSPIPSPAATFPDQGAEAGGTDAPF